MLERDFSELLGQMRSCEDPVSIPVRRFEPAAGYQIKERAIGSRGEEIAVSVAYPKQARSGNRSKRWLPINENEFGWLSAEVDRRHLSRMLARKVCDHVLPVIV